MDRNTKATYKRGAFILLPVLGLVVIYSLRIYARMPHHDRDDTIIENALHEQRLNELAQQQQNTPPTTGRSPKPRRVAQMADGGVGSMIAVGRPLPDSIVADAERVYWLDTGSGEVVSASHEGGAVTVLAKGLRLAHPRHAQALALAKGSLWVAIADTRTESGGVARVDTKGADLTDDKTADAGAGANVVITDRDVSSVFADEKYVYYAIAPTPSRLEDGGLLGGVYRFDPVTSQSKLLAPAEHPCALASDGTYVYFAEPLSVSRVQIAGGSSARIVSSDRKLACSLALDATHVYWLTPSEDAVMRAMKDGSRLTALAFEHTKPVAVVATKSAVFSMTETSDQGLGELGGLWSTAFGATGSLSVVDELSGLDGLATDGNDVFYTRYDSDESDGQIVMIPGRHTPATDGGL